MIIDIIKEKMKVKQITKTLFEVNNHSIKIQTKKGRKIILCSCQNSSRFADNNLCHHKQLVLQYIYTKKIKERLDKLIPVYKNWDKLKLPLNPRLLLNDLESLRRML